MSKNIVAIMLALFENADCLMVDDSPLISSVSTYDVNGDDDNQVIFIKWTDGEDEFSVILTEESLKDGRWVNDVFVTTDHEGEEVRVVFFDLKKKKMPTTNEVSNLNMQVENAILEVVNLYDELTTSDLQGVSLSASVSCRAAN